VIYVDSLGALLMTSLDTSDGFTGNVVKIVSLHNVHELITNPTFRTVTFRTIGIASAVTVTDLVLALPVAFLAKVASRRTRRALAVAMVLPLWMSYLVKAYSWRVILDPAGGVLRKAFGFSPGFGVTGIVVVLAYLWLPYMALPIYVGLEKLPDSLLDASGDLGGRTVRTFWSVVLPLLSHRSSPGPSSRSRSRWATTSPCRSSVARPRPSAASSLATSAPATCRRLRPWPWCPC
jgi:putative spermidine/putrescine transport system permease protein